MAYDFPASPTDGQAFSPSGGPDYVYSTAVGAWLIKTGGINTAFVNKSGDTMSGDLVIAKATPSLLINKAASGQPARIYGQTNGVNRWHLSLGGNGAETGGNAGSDFALGRYDDAGVLSTTSAIAVNRANGDTTFSGNIANPGTVFSGQLWVGYGLNSAVNPAVIRFGGTTGDKYMIWDGANFSLTGSNLLLSHTLSTGLVSYGAAGTILDGGGGNMLLRATQQIFQREDGTAAAIYFRQSDGAVIANYDVYKPGGGPWLDSSDSRIKNVEGNYTRGLADVVQLRPITYTFKGNDTNEPPGHITKSDEPVVVPYPNSSHNAAAKAGKKFAGLIAQEVETVIPEMVKKRDGYIDGVAVTDLRDLDTAPLIFALINSIKELNARIAALEAAMPT